MKFGNFGDFKIEYSNSRWVTINYRGMGLLSISGDIDEGLYLWKSYNCHVEWDTDMDNRPIIDGVDEV